MPCLAVELRPAQSFPDGIEAKVEAVEIGKAFSHAAEEPEEHPVHSDGSPCGWRAYGNFRFVPSPGDQALYVWFRTNNLYDLWDAALVGEDGLIDRKFCFDALEQLVSSKARIVGFRFSSYPRRQKTLRVLLIRGGEWKKQGKTPAALEFSVSNPAVHSREQWKAESVPAARNVEGFTLAVESLETGMTQTNADGAAQSLCKVRMSAAAEGKPSGDWGVRMLVLTDITGNRLEKYLQSGVERFDKSGRLEMTFYEPLWTSENAWRIDAECVRTDALPQSQTVTLPALTIQPVQHMIGREQKQKIEFHVPEFPGVTIRASYYTFSDQPGHLLRLVFRFEEIPEGLHCGIVKVADANGNRCPRVFGNNDFPFKKPGEKENPEYLIDIPDSSQTIAISFGVQRVRTLQFQVKPAVVREPVAPKRE